MDDARLKTAGGAAVRRLGILLAIASVGSVISAVLLPSQASAIVGGTASPDGFVARVETDAARCSGALVDARWVLTLRSCVAPAGSEPGAPAQATRVSVGRPASGAGAAGGYDRTVVEVIPHPEQDVALLRLNEAVPQAVAPVALGAPAQTGEALRAAGYGRTGQVWAPEQPQAAGFVVTSVAADAVQAQPADSSAGACKGDAGGPVVRQESARAALVALTAASWQAGCLDAEETRRGAALTRVDGLAGWVAGSTGACASTPAGLQSLPDVGGQDGAWRSAGGAAVAVDGCEVAVTGGGVRWLATDHLPDTYRLRVDWRATAASVSSAVVVGLGNPEGDLAGALAQGVQVAIAPRGTGNAATGGVVGLSPPSADVQRPVGQWNTFEIAVTGRQLTVALNGQQVNSVQVPADRLGRRLWLGLRGPGGNAAVRFRDLAVGFTQPQFGSLRGVGGKCVDISGYSTDDGATAWLHGCHGERNQDVVVPGDGTMRIMGKCLDFGGPVNGDSRTVHLWTCGVPDRHGADRSTVLRNQTWQFRPNGEIVDPTGRCLDAARTSEEKLVTYPCHGGENQRWQFRPASDTAPIGFGPLLGIGGQCVDAAGFSPADGTALTLFGCHGERNQDLTVPGDGTIRVLGKCLDAGGAQNGDAQLVHLWTCAARTGLPRPEVNPNQIWTWGPGGTIRLASTGRCLDAQRTTEQRLSTYPCSNEPHQRWSRPLSSPGRYTGDVVESSSTETGSGQTQAASVVARAAAGAAGTADAADEPPTAQNGGSVLEDYAYPGAAAILEEQGVRLISGDGRIVLADCSTPPTGDIGLVRVHTTEEIGAGGRGLICFKILATPGLLRLEVPAVYEIRGDGRRSGTGHRLTAEVTTDDGEHTEVQVNPSGSTQVGIGADPDAEPTTLLELRSPA